MAHRHFPQYGQDEDLLQCGLIGLWRAAQAWDRKRTFSTFAYRCIHNEMCSYLRKVCRWGPTLPQHPGTEATIHPQRQVDERLDLDQAIGEAWPAGSREHLVLTALAHGVSKPDLAAALGTNTYAITRLAKRAYRAIDFTD